jgi:formate dehydrogenase iron-sulfur subunit
MSAVVYVPRDAAALSVGAERVALAIAAEAASRGIDLTLKRNGTRGMCWLEPLVEVVVGSERYGYGPVTERDVPELFAGNFLRNGAHALQLGRVDEIPYFATQRRLTFERVGVIEPTSLDDYLRHGGYEGLRHALRMQPQEIVQVVTESGLRGRGGAAFPTGIKWKTVLDTPSAQKYVTCNADEGDSGTFADRMLMEGDPFSLIEGMTIAALAVGATQGYIYLRIEYPHAERALSDAIKSAYSAGYLGADVAGSGRRFDLEVRMGAGAYICGEETSMLESLEGRRGEVRVRPPLPAVKGLFGRPTIVNNVISLASVPIILNRGAQFYRDFGVGRSRGTLPIQLAGNIKRGGLVERAFGVSLRDLLYDYGGGSASGRPIRAVQVGGPLGAYVPASQFDGRHGAHGALCDGVLRDRVVRKVHAVPHRLDPRRRGHRPHSVRGRSRWEPAAAGGSLRDDGRGLALRPRRSDAVSGAQRIAPLQGRFSETSTVVSVQCFLSIITTSVLRPAKALSPLPWKSTAAP